MKEQRRFCAGEPTPSTPSEIQLVFNSASPFVVYANNTYTFKVIDRENAPGAVQYQWKVANGNIIEGQGKSSIKVKFNEVYGGSVTVQACNEAGKCSDAIEQYVMILKK
jgi:hypothetical protein